MARSSLHHVDVTWLHELKNICHSYIGLHGAYPKHMKMFWEHRGKFRSNGGNLLTHSDVCVLTEPYDWKVFNDIWLYRPTRCISNPVWDTSKQSVTGGSYTGRQNM